MKHNKSILAIFVDEDSLSMVQLGETKTGLHIHNWATEPLEEGIVKNGLIINNNRIAQKIRRFARAKRIKARKVVISPSLASVRLNPSKITTQTDEQLHEQIEEQIEKYALFDGEQIVFDYCTIEGSTETSRSNVVLQAVTTRRISDACLAVAHQARLNSVEIEPVILPLIKIIYDKVLADSRSVSLLLALDSVSGTMIVFKAGILQLCQNLSIGNKGISQDGNGFSSLIDQMKPVLGFARSLADSKQLVLTVAASCSSKEVQATVGRIRQSFSDVTVEQINAARIAEQFDVRGVNSEDLPVFAFASAVAGLDVYESTEQLNLVSKQSQARYKVLNELSLMAKVIVAIVLLSFASIIPLKTKIRNVKALSSEIEAKITQTEPMKQKIAALTKQFKQLKEKQTAYAAANSSLAHIPWPDALQIIAETVPDEVRIIGISATGQADFMLVGEALAEKNVYLFVKRLQNTELIHSSKIEEIEYYGEAAEAMVDYKIICKIQLPESNL